MSLSKLSKAELIKRIETVQRLCRSLAESTKKDALEYKDMAEATIGQHTKEWRLEEAFRLESIAKAYSWPAELIDDMANKEQFP
jgi:hypothetical protein